MSRGYPVACRASHRPGVRRGPRHEQANESVRREPIWMIRLAIFACALWTFVMSVALAASGAAAERVTTPLAPGCSIAAADGPALSNVMTSFVPVVGEPFGIAITSKSNYAFVASPTGSIIEYAMKSVDLRSVQTDTFGTVRPHQAPIGGTSPVGLALSPNGRYLVAAADSGAVVVNVKQLEKKGSSSSSWTVGTLGSPGSGAIETTLSSDGHFVFVSLEDSDELAVFNLQRALTHGFGPSDLVGMVPLGVAPVGVAVSPNGRYLYVTSELRSTTQSEGTLTTIDLKKAEQHPLHSVISTVVAGCSPVRVVANMKSVFVTARESDALLEFSAKDLVSDPGAALKYSVPVGEAPVDLALVKNGRLLVIADSDRFGAAGRQPNLAVVAVPANASPILDGYVRSGEFPRDMALSPNGKTLLVSNFLSGQLEAIKVSTLP
jgi:DNA-binding beta-propeller fold protein YncE